MLFDMHEDRDAMPVIGTAFGFQRHGLLLTAAHVISDSAVDDLRVVCCAGDSPVSYDVASVEAHSHADLAAIRLEGPCGELEHYTLYEPDGLEDMPLGNSVLAFGYFGLGNEIPPVPARMMKGHTQRRLTYMDKEKRRYTAYELGFPSFSGLSGAPVVDDNDRLAVVGVVTNSIRLTDTGERIWAIGASLNAVRDWLEAL